MIKCKTCNGLGRTKATEFVGVDEGLREVVILCPTCGGTGIDYDHEFIDVCKNCDGTGIIKPLTNEEWFCGLPTEEKAKTIVCLAVNAFHKQKKEIDVDKIKQWLQEEHKW